MATPPSDDGERPALLRRRIVFELSVDQLPLLESAERRHGTKRRALIRALQADTRLAELERANSELEQRLAQAEAERDAAAADRANTEATTTKRQQREAAAAKKQWARERQRLEQQAAALEQALDEQEDELERVEARAVDEAFCARCGNWAAPETWRWRTSETGEVAFHASCGDHGPGLLGSSWLAYRANLTR